MTFFSIRATHNGRHTWLTQGDKIDLEFEDGKGVSGRIRGVNVGPGGSSFSIVVQGGGQPFGRDTEQVVLQASDARPETSCNEAKDADGSDDLTASERALLGSLRARNADVDELQRKLNELSIRLDSRTRQLARSRAQHDEKNERIRELEAKFDSAIRERNDQADKTMKARAQVEELRASLRDLGNDYRIAQEMLDQEREALLRADQQLRDYRETIAELGQKVQERKKINRVSGGTINQSLTQIFNTPTTQQVLAFRERPRQRVVTQHDEDGSVTIRVELREGN